MTERAIQVTSYDRDRLMEVIAEKRKRTGLAEREDWLIRALEQKLLRAQVLSWDLIPHRVVTMNSQLSLEEEGNGARTIVEVVFPEDASVKLNRISILTQLGIALLGLEVGEVVELDDFLGGPRFRLVALLYQPEENLRANRSVSQ